MNVALSLKNVKSNAVIIKNSSNATKKPDNVRSRKQLGICMLEWEKKTDFESFLIKLDRP